MMSECCSARRDLLLFRDLSDLMIFILYNLVFEKKDLKRHLSISCFTPF